MAPDVAYDSSSEESNTPLIKIIPHVSPKIRLIIRKPSVVSQDANENSSIPLSPLTVKPPSRGKPIMKPINGQTTSNALKPPEERSFQDLFPSLEMSSTLEMNIIENNSIRDLASEIAKESVCSTPSGISSNPILKEQLALPDVQVKTREIIDYLDPKFINDDQDYADDFKLPNKHFLRARESLDQPNLQIEYDMDEEDRKWLSLFMSKKRTSTVAPQYLKAFETLMDHIEKGWFDISRQKKYENLTLQDIQAKSDACCEICDKNDCENSNCIVFCDGCDLAVHQMCYGVPFIPEGEWLCRKCMVSPGNPVSCLFCPNEGGAFKQTTNNKWAHVLCADWIPETSFVNLDTMEPITNVDMIPKSRWKLICYICKQKEGAPIQCSIRTCTTAFHATCARMAKFYMKIKLNKYNALEWKVCCHRHTPMKFKDKVIYNEVQQKLHEKFSSIPKQSRNRHNRDLSYSKSARAHQQSFSTEEIIVPFTLYKSALEVITKFNLSQPEWFVNGVCQYWSLKKQRYRGAYLIKRLHLEPWTAKIPSNLDGKHEQTEHETLLARRTELERILMLTELIRKRERTKAKLYRNITQYWEAFFVPYKPLLTWAVEKLQRMDTAFMFAEPVTDEFAPLYSTIIKHPMDFTTLSNKVQSNSYFNIEDFKTDVNLIYDNCMTYNDKSTIFYNTAKRHKARAEGVFTQLEQQWKDLNTNPELGTLSNEFDISKILPYFKPVESLTQLPQSPKPNFSSSDELSALTSDSLDSLHPPSPSRPPMASNSAKSSATKSSEKPKLSSSTRVLRKSTRPPRPNLRSCPQQTPLRFGKLSKEAQLLIKEQPFSSKKASKKKV